MAPRRRNGARRGWLLALTAVVAAAAGFGVVAAAFPERDRQPGGGRRHPEFERARRGRLRRGAVERSGERHATRAARAAGSPPPPGRRSAWRSAAASTAVSAASITLDGGGQAITAAVTRATTITGKVTSIAGIKVGDFVSASITGANGKLTADSIQDPASLPSGSGQ